MNVAGLKVDLETLYDGPDHTFSSGYLYFGDQGSGHAETYQSDFAGRMNEALTDVGADFRLG